MYVQERYCKLSKKHLGEGKLSSESAADFDFMCVVFNLSKGENFLLSNTIVILGKMLLDLVPILHDNNWSHHYMSSSRTSVLTHMGARGVCRSEVQITGSTHIHCVLCYYKTNDS